ncbi:MAG TPA: hypothetical protein VMV33_01510 [Rhodocyclaceae bacterium]|nr:hypothetical protein [Rhodocyclaceae bacterium]
MPWRFSDAGKHRATLNHGNTASEKPAQKYALAVALGYARVSTNKDMGVTFESLTALW